MAAPIDFSSAVGRRTKLAETGAESTSRVRYLQEVPSGLHRRLFLGQANGFADPRRDLIAAKELARGLRHWTHQVDDVNELELALFAGLDRLLPGHH